MGLTWCRRCVGDSLSSPLGVEKVCRAGQGENAGERAMGIGANEAGGCERQAPLLLYSHCATRQ
eukprot:630020-Prorocentrum_lima.AAC.1